MNEQLVGDLFAEATSRMTGSSSKEFAEKFAELIVAECIDAAVEAQADFYIVHNIQSRFGVEE